MPIEPTKRHAKVGSFLSSLAEMPLEEVARSAIIAKIHAPGMRAATSEAKRRVTDAGRRVVDRVTTPASPHAPRNQLMNELRTKMNLRRSTEPQGVGSAFSAIPGIGSIGRVARGVFGGGG